jgi:hypothetical protein
MIMDQDSQVFAVHVAWIRMKGARGDVSDNGKNKNNQNERFQKRGYSCTVKAKSIPAPRIYPVVPQPDQ